MVSLATRFQASCAVSNQLCCFGGSGPCLPAGPGSGGADTERQLLNKLKTVSGLHHLENIATIMLL